MNVYDNSLYLEDVNYVANLNLPWEKLNNKLENVNVSPFTFFYISKLFKINKLMDVR